MIVKTIDKTQVQKLTGGSPPDIDSDFSSKDRDKIKEYIEKRFGKSQVCSIGSYTTLQMKGIIKDLSKIFGIEFTKANLITNILSQLDKNTSPTIFDILAVSQEEPKLKAFLLDNPDILYWMPVIMNQIRAKSIHPCAMVILPNTMGSEHWLPIRDQQGQIVTDWEGEDIESAGFLKEDILGIKQLDKISDILKLVEANGKEVPDIYNLPNDEKVYRYFSNGWCSDIFQFGSKGLTNYIKRLRPEVFEDLVVATTLYRPGAMDNGLHEVYIKCKNEGRLPEYLWGTEEITATTYGIITFQEQVMQAVMELGNLSLVDADDVRRAMGKKKLSVLKEYEGKVREGYLANGATEEEFNETWENLQAFARYSFNRSHAVAYSKLSYITQYLKANYPNEFWATALKYADDKKKPSYLAEISEIGSIEDSKLTIEGVDINGSQVYMKLDNDKDTIYFGFNSLKGVGEVAATQIVKNRGEFTPYTSFQDFYDRNVYKGSKVNKTTVEVLILSGAFDAIEDVHEKCERLDIVNRYRELIKYKKGAARDKFESPDKQYSWWWELRQKEYSGVLSLELEPIIEENGFSDVFTQNQVNTDQDFGIFGTYGGYVTNSKLINGKNGKFIFIDFEYKNKIHSLAVWNDEYEKLKRIITNPKGKLIVFEGELKYNEKYTQKNGFTLKSFSKIMVLG